jgi:hypothetical protein
MLRWLWRHDQAGVFRKVRHDTRPFRQGSKLPSLEPGAKRIGCSTADNAALPDSHFMVAALFFGHVAHAYPPGGFIAPCLPTKAETLPFGGLWLHEIKHDGFRVIARKDGARVRLYSRPGNDLTYRFPLIVEALAHLRSRSCIIDGEAVACDDKGAASFDRIRYRSPWSAPGLRRRKPSGWSPADGRLRSRGCGLRRRGGGCLDDAA